MRKLKMLACNKFNKGSHIMVRLGLAQSFIVFHSSFFMNANWWKSGPKKIKVHQQPAGTPVAIIKGMQINL
jgi:hypothetical protein